MRTQETFSLMKSAKDIAIAIDIDGERIAGLLNEQNPLPPVEGETAFDYRKHMQSLRLQLDAAKERLADAEDEHVARQIRQARRQSERDEVALEQYTKMVTAREGLESLYPQGSFELAFLKGKTPRVPERLLEQLVQTVKLLKQPAVEPRRLKNAAFSVDFDKIIADLEPAIRALHDAIGEYDRTNKEVEGSLLIKRDAIEQLHRTVLWVGRTTEGLFHLAGEDELAKRIRKTTRRPLRPSEQPEEASSETTPSDAEASEVVTLDPSPSETSKSVPLARASA